MHLYCTMHNHKSSVSTLYVAHTSLSLMLSQTAKACHSSLTACTLCTIAASSTQHDEAGSHPAATPILDAPGGVVI